MLPLSLLRRNRTTVRALRAATHAARERPPSVRRGGLWLFAGCSNLSPQGMSSYPVAGGGKFPANLCQRANATRG